MDPLAPLLDALAEAANRGADVRPTRLGRVAAVGAATVSVQLDGELAPSGRTYPRLAGYAPTVGDRVLLLRVGSTYVAVGAVAAAVATDPPVTTDPEPEPDPVVVDGDETLNTP